MAYLSKVSEIDIDGAYSKNTPRRLLGIGINNVFRNYIDD